MVNAGITTAVVISIAFNRNVDVNAFLASYFTSNPSGEVGVGIVQLTDRIIEVNFDNPIDSDTSITLNQVVPGIISPATINYA
jgi:hypothetical protein